MGPHVVFLLALLSFCVCTALWLRAERGRDEAGKVAAYLGMTISLIVCILAFLGGLQ